jgi:hypothetical protein
VYSEGVGQEDSEGVGGKRTRTQWVWGRSSMSTWRVWDRSTTRTQRVQAKSTMVALRMTREGRVTGML